METLLRKYLWAVDLAVIALCAMFAARAAATAIESSLVKSTANVKRPPRAAVPTAAGPVYSKQIEETLNRNIFCSKCPPILEKPKAEGEDKPVIPPLQRTSLNLKVLAIMFAPPPADPRWSIAIIRDNDDHTTGPYSIGSRLRDSTIDEVEEARVILLFADGRREFIDLLDRPQPAPGAPAVAAAAPAAAADPFTAELDRGIKKLSEHNYEVQRSTVDSLLGNMGALAKGARIVPETRDGKAAGFRLFSIRPEGPFAKIGLQNGDVISAINGLEMTSPDKALEVYTKLKTANHLSVAVERGGQKITKDYNIR